MKKVDMKILQTDLTLKESQVNKVKNSASAGNVIANSLAGGNEFVIGEQLELSKTLQDDKTKKVKVKNSDGTESVTEYNVKCPDDIRNELSRMGINIGIIDSMTTVSDESWKKISMSAKDCKIEWTTEWNEEGTQVVASLKIYDKDGKIVVDETNLLDKNGNIIESFNK